MPNHVKIFDVVEKYLTKLSQQLGAPRHFEFSKRHKFILISILSSFALAATQLVPVSMRYQTVALFGFLVLGFSLIALWDELAGIKFIILLILPVYFSVAIALFYFLLPVRWLTRLPVIAGYGISIYLLFLTQNIYNIAAIRTIQLLRAAHAVGFLFTVVTAFLLLNVVFALRFDPWWIALASIIISFPLLLSAIWSFELEEFLSKRVFVFAIILSLAVGQIAWAISFWPVLPIIGALTVVSALYVFLGTTQFHFAQRLNKRTIYEYSLVAAVVFILVMLTTSWRG